MVSYTPLAVDTLWKAGLFHSNNWLFHSNKRETAETIHYSTGTTFNRHNI